MDRFLIVTRDGDGSGVITGDLKFYGLFESPGDAIDYAVNNLKTDWEVSRIESVSGKVVD